jgi:hypothetical protein
MSFRRVLSAAVVLGLVGGGIVLGWNQLILPDGVARPGEVPAGDVPQATVSVEFLDMDGNRITSVHRGTAIRVFARFPETGPPLDSACILELPVNKPIYKETKAFARHYDRSAVGQMFPFYIPDWLQIEGTATATVVVQGAGGGTAKLEILP